MLAEYLVWKTNKNNGKPELFTCRKCGFPLYKICWLGINMLYCSVCHQAFGIILNKN